MQHKDKPLVYVCAPFRADTPEGIRANISHAVTLAEALAIAGFFPLCPHLLGEGWKKELLEDNDDFWLSLTMEVMRRCDVVYLSPEWEGSSGCLGELEEAHRLGIPTIYNMLEAKMFLAGWECRGGHDER